MDGYLQELDEGECAHLLRSVGVGRVAFVGRDGLTVHPVAFAYEHPRVWVRTAAGAALAQLAEGMPIAFEVDEYDPETGTGWSVLGRGSVRGPDAPPSELPVPWAPGERDHVICLQLASLSGRAVSARSAE